MVAKILYPVSQPDVGDLEALYVNQAVRSGWLSSIGPFVSRFEQEFAQLTGTKFGVSTSNGTDAIFVALKALNIGPGDEVIVPALTFVAVASAVVRSGASPVFVDVHPDYWCIDPDQITAAVGERTRAVIAVHSYGHPANMPAILRIARERDVFVIEDCAEAHAAKVAGGVVGSLGDVGCFSFYGNKIITTGEGGIIVTNDKDLAERCQYLKDHAMDRGRYYYHSEVGYNCRMTNLQAAVGCAQIERFDEILATRRRILDYYQDEFSDCGSIRLNPRMKWAEPVNWLVSALVVDADGEERDGLRACLKEHGIDSRPFFYPLNELPPYRVYAEKRPFPTPVARRISQSGLNLPTSNDLRREDVARIAGEVKSFLAQQR